MEGVSRDHLVQLVLQEQFSRVVSIGKCPGDSKTSLWASYSSAQRMELPVFCFVLIISSAVSGVVLGGVTSGT